MYSFNQRPDMSMMDEPFYALWLKRIGKIQPCYDEVMATFETRDTNRVHDKIEREEKIKGNIFVKNMANTVEDMNKDRFLNYQHIFLIRDPVETILSHIKVDAEITGEDLCLEHQVKLYEWLKDNEKDPVVIDGNDLRKNPEEVLMAVCQKLNLPYTNAMLSWPAGPKSVDGIWASAWYTEVHTSTGFRPPNTKKVTRGDLPSEFLQLYDEVLPYYQKLLTYRIQV